MSSGKDILKAAERHLGEAYVLGTPVNYDDPDYAGPWDCAEFASWCFWTAAQIRFGMRKEGSKWGAYSGHWATDAEKNKVAIRPSEAAWVAGAVLVRIPVSKVISGHVALSDGDNGTVEAMGAKYGVTRGKIARRAWDLGVLVPGIDYSGTSFSALPTGAAFALRATNPTARGPLVSRIVKKLKKLGLYDGDDTELYDVNVAASVARFQADQGLVVDGEYGSKTESMLLRASDRRARGRR